MKDKGEKIHRLRLKPKNWLFIGAGIVFILMGYLFLSKGSLVIAPILLVAGYCVLIPVGIMVK